MAEIRTVTTLRTKAASIEAAITNYENRLAQARADLAKVNAVIELFEGKGEPARIVPYVDLHRVFARGELVKLCKPVLERGQATTPELAEHVMRVCGLDVSDKVLRRAVCYRLVQALRVHTKRGTIKEAGKAKGGICIWTLKQSP